MFVVRNITDERTQYSARSSATFRTNVRNIAYDKTDGEKSFFSGDVYKRIKVIGKTKMSYEDCYGEAELTLPVFMESEVWFGFMISDNKKSVPRKARFMIVCVYSLYFNTDIFFEDIMPVIVMKFRCGVLKIFH